MFAITNMANQHASDMASPWMVCQQHCHCNIYMFQIFTGNWTHFCPLQSQSKTNRWTVPTALEYQNMTFNHKVCIFHSNIWDHWHFGSQQIAKDRFEGRWVAVAPVSIFVMLLEEAPIAVDSFNHPGVELGGPQIYFCSHAHEDHMKGLSKKWRKGPDGMKWPEIFLIGEECRDVRLNFDIKVEGCGLLRWICWVSEAPNSHDCWTYWLEVRIFCTYSTDIADPLMATFFISVRSVFFFRRCADDCEHFRAFDGNLRKIYCRWIKSGPLHLICYWGGYAFLPKVCGWCWDPSGCRTPLCFRDHWPAVETAMASFGYHGFL